MIAESPSREPPTSPSSLGLLRRGGASSLLVLLGGNLLGALVGGLFFLAAARGLTLAEMGIYSAAISAQWIMGGLVGTGLGVATVRLAALYLGRDLRQQAAGIVVIAGLSAAAIHLTIAAASLWVAPQPADLLLLSGRLLGLVALWAGARAALDCWRSGLLAQQQYTRAALLTMLGALTGLGALSVTLVTGELTLQRLIIAHLIGLGTIAILGPSLLWPLWKHGIKVDRVRSLELLRYARWPALGEAIRLAQAHLGPFVLLAVSQPAEAGLFGLGRYPAYICGVLVATLYQYWLPEAAREGDRGQLRPFLSRQIRTAVWLGCGLLALGVVMLPFLPLLGDKFVDVGPLFVLNTLDFALVVLVMPAETAFHALRKPYLELAGRVSGLLLLMALAPWLASRYGALGMAGTQVLSTATAVGVAAWLLVRQQRP